MYTRCFEFKGVKWGKSYVHIVIARVCDTYFGAPPPEFSTLLEINEAVIMYVHVRCT